LRIITSIAVIKLQPLYMNRNSKQRTFCEWFSYVTTVDITLRNVLHWLMVSIAAAKKRTVKRSR